MATAAAASLVIRTFLRLVRLRLLIGGALRRRLALMRSSTATTRAARRIATATGPARSRDRHLGALAQLVGAVHDDLVARLQAGGHGNALPFGRAGLDRPRRDGVVRLDLVDEGSLRAA